MAWIGAVTPSNSSSRTSASSTVLAFNLLWKAAPSSCSGRLDRSCPDQHKFVAWTSSDGGTSWDLNDAPFPEAAFITDLFRIGSGFAAAGHVEGVAGGPRVWWSDDGIDWRESEAPSPALGSTLGEAYATWNDSLVGVANIESAVELWSSGDGESWERLPDPELGATAEEVITIERVAAGRLGIVLTGERQPQGPPDPPVIIEKDDLIVTFHVFEGRLEVTIKLET